MHLLGSPCVNSQRSGLIRDAFTKTMPWTVLFIDSSSALPIFGCHAPVGRPLSLDVVFMEGRMLAFPLCKTQCHCSLSCGWIVPVCREPIHSLCGATKGADRPSYARHDVPLPVGRSCWYSPRPSALDVPSVLLPQTALAQSLMAIWLRPLMEACHLSEGLVMPTTGSCVHHAPAVASDPFVRMRVMCAILDGGGRGPGFACVRACEWISRTCPPLLARTALASSGCTLPSCSIASLM